MATGRQSEKEDLQKNYGSLKGEKETLGKENEALQKNYGSLKTEKETLGKENEALQKNYGSLKTEKETLGKEKEALQKNYEIIKSENERLGKEASSEVGFYVAVAAAVWIFVCFACHTARVKRETKKLTREKEGLLEQNENGGLLEQNESLKREKETLGKEKEDLQKNYDSLKIVKDELGKQNGGLLEQNDILKREKESLVKDCEELQQDRNILKSEKNKLGKENGGLLDQNETLKQEKEKVEADFEELRRKTNTCGYVLDREWKPITEACVNVTLDPNTAGPRLTVSEDGSRVRFTGERSAEWPSVLGREGFTSGSHYWEVEVGEKGYWVLGVSTHPHEKSIPEKPEKGYWLVRLVKGKTCTALSQSRDQILNLGKICKVWGVYLDKERGRLSFYNAETRFHIHTLECSFPGQVYPIFSPGSHDKGPLIINTKVKNV
ncbi:nuclear factor 7, ovary-like [Acipenser ruthenus]|uniref:nuclear factor 7, ovary-like n=1 Tax=Acipenser ruthenus TaxID=7906 RepID=UPI00274068A7|nr:nuclear factor 7, ovary-like [Acipenser ruthenus]